MSERKWMCIRCMEEHDIIDGVVQCKAASPPKPMSEDEYNELIRWMREDLPLLDI